MSVPPTKGPLDPTKPIDWSTIDERIQRQIAPFLRAVLDTGYIEAPTTTTIQDTTKNWDVNELVGLYVYIVRGGGAGHLRRIASNTATVITVTNGFTTVPELNALYYIIAIRGGILESATNPNTRISVWNGSTEAGVGTLGDASGISSLNGLNVWSIPMFFNGTTWDRGRANLNLYNVSETTTATFTGADISTFNAKALIIVIDCTSLTGTSYTPEVDWKDGAANYPVLWKQSTAKTAAARTVIVLGPGSAGAVVDAGAAAGDAGLGTVDSATAAQLVQIPFAVPNTIRIKITKSAVTAFTANLQVQGS